MTTHKKIILFLGINLDGMKSKLTQTLWSAVDKIRNIPEHRSQNITEDAKKYINFYKKIILMCNNNNSNNSVLQKIYNNKINKNNITQKRENK